MSRGFLAALFGIGMTLVSWFGPWAWPAAPAFFVLNVCFGGSYHELPYAGRAAVLVLLIAANVTAWGAAAWAIARPFARRRQPPL